MAVEELPVGLVCLQGGGEFAPACDAMDRVLLERAGRGPVVVLPAAAAPGREYDRAGRHGVRHLTRLGAGDVLVAPDPRADPAGARDAVDVAALLFLPGGSPSRLRDALVATPLGAAVRAAAERAVVAGASAGAMVLCARTVLPEHGTPEVADGLGVVPDFAVLPHHRPGGGDAWLAALRAAAPGIDVLGIPECAGVLLDGEHVVAVGAAATTLYTGDGAYELAW